MRCRGSAFATLMALVALISTAHAAQISAPGFHAIAVKENDKISTYWPTDPVKCDLILDGDIVEGDAVTLKQKFEAIVGSWYAFSFFLCLRSLGGSVPEALKIAKFILDTQRPSIATVVEDGQICASACAFIFLAGNAPAARSAWPQRFLHPRGQLRFHSSFLDLSRYSDHYILEDLKSLTDGRSLKEKIADIYKDGLRDVQSVISTFQNPMYEREDLRERWVRPSLFLEMFSQNFDEWICIDSVDAIGRWDIQVFGYLPPKTPTKQQFLNVCHNAYKWRSDTFATDETDNDENDASTLTIKRPSPKEKLGGRNKDDGDFDQRYSLEYQAPSLGLTCVIEVKYRESNVLDPTSDLTVYFVRGGGTLTRLAPTAYFKADTLITDLPMARQSRVDPTRVRPKQNFDRYPYSRMNGCTLKSIPNASEEECQAKCSDDAACLAYSHNKFTQTCELKHTLTAWRIDPRWTTGAPVTTPRISRSSRAIRMNPVPINGRIDGQVMGASKIDDDRGRQGPICASSCESDRACLAVELEFNTDLCRKFSAVNGLRKANDKQPVEAYIKSQQ